MHFLMMSQSEPQEARSIFCCTMMSFSWERTSRTCTVTENIKKLQTFIGGIFPS